MNPSRPFTNALELLRAARLRPTRQRLALARLLFERGDRHVTAEQLHGEALAASVPVSLATVYNTLHQFIEAGLLREVVVNSGRSYFDTNVERPPPFLLRGRRPAASTFPASISASPACRRRPHGTAIRRVDVIIRIDAADRPVRHSPNLELFQSVLTRRRPGHIHRRQPTASSPWLPDSEEGQNGHP